MHPVVVWTTIATIYMCVCTCTGKGSACDVLIQTEGAYRIEGKFTNFNGVCTRDCMSANIRKTRLPLLSLLLLFKYHQLVTVHNYMLQWNALQPCHNLSHL